MHRCCGKTSDQFAFPPTPLSIAILELLVARMAEVLVKESSHIVLSLAAECIGSLKLGALPAAPEMALSLKSFMAQEMHGCMTCTVAALFWQLLYVSIQYQFTAVLAGHLT